MEITAVRSSRLRLPSSVGRTSASIVQLATENTRLSAFFALMKPRVMLLAVFTALAGMLIAPTHLDLLLGAVAIVAIAIGAGAAGVLNMWYDADIDRVMSRTATRPIPRGTVSRAEALALGLVLAACSVAVLALASNLEAAGLLAFAIFFYVVVYTIWLKRCTPQSIVIGGGAGALPPAIGWAAATGEIGLEPIILFLIVFLWTPPHFWALALNRTDEYARAGIPMLPVVAGRIATTRQILVYSVLLVPISVLPSVLGFAGVIYDATAAICGAIFVALAWRLQRSKATDRVAATRLFAFSIFYLFALFAALLASSANRPAPPLAAHAVSGAAGSATAEFLPQIAQAAGHPAGDSRSISADEA